MANNDEGYDVVDASGEHHWVDNSGNRAVPPELVELRNAFPELPQNLRQRRIARTVTCAASDQLDPCLRLKLSIDTPGAISSRLCVYHDAVHVDAWQMNVARINRSSINILRHKTLSGGILGRVSRHSCPP